MKHRSVLRQERQLETNSTAYRLAKVAEKLVQAFGISSEYKGG